MYHCPIDSVQRVATKTVLRYRRHSSLFAETPTASNVAVTQIGCCCLMLSSAIAKTIPNSVPVFTFDTNLRGFQKSSGPACSASGRLR
jgi:hypothetical protein